MDIFAHLQRLPEESQPWVTAALRQDRLLWEALCSLENLGPQGAAAIESARTPEEWSPAALGLAFIELPVSLAHLHTLGALPGELRRQAARACEHLAAQPAAPINLPISTLLALALYERRRLTGGWKSLPEDLKRLPAAALPPLLACLYGLLPHPGELLAALLDAAPPAASAPLLIHTVLCQPLPGETHAALLLALPAAPRKLLPAARAQSPALAARLAAALLEKDTPRPPTASRQKPAPAEEQTGQSQPGERRSLLAFPAASEEGNAFQYDYAQITAAITTAWQEAELLHIARQPAPARLALQQAAAAENRLHALRSAYLAHLTALDETASPGELAAAWEEAAQGNPHIADYRAALSLALLDAKRPAEAAAALGGLEKHTASASAILGLARARLAAHQSERENAQRLAQETLAQWETLVDSNRPTDQRPTTENRQTRRALLSHPLSLLRSPFSLLASLLPSADAARAWQLALECQPNDAALLLGLAEAHLAAGDNQAARAAARLARLLALPQPAQRRRLAAALQAAGASDDALAEYARLAALPHADPCDLHALAACALRAGQPAQATAACQRALQDHPEDGEALLLLGHSLAASEHLPEAIHAYQQAAAAQPAQPEAWLSLATALEKNGQMQSALETLRTAAQAVPQSAAVQQALGEAYAQANLPTPALAAWQRAARLSPADARLHLRLGQTLLQLGRVEEARSALAAAHALDTEVPGLAYTYAQALLALDEEPAALPLLHAAATSQDSTAASANLALSHILLKQARPAAAAEAAQQALRLDPSLAEAQAILAEALAAADQTQAALQAYRTALETHLAQIPPWQERLTLGLGRAALNAGQTGIALAALQEAIQAAPSNPQAHRLLAEANLAAGLYPHTLQAIRAARRLAPDEAEALLWCANMLLQLSQAWQKTSPGDTLPQLHTEARGCLQRAAELAPPRADIRLRLAEVQFYTGDRPAASESLAALASLETASPAELRQAADWLFDRLNEPQRAADCYRKALTLGAGANEGAPSAGNIPPWELRLALARTLRAAADPRGALAALEPAFTQANLAPALYAEKAAVLMALDRPGEALECLRASPAGDPAISLQMAILLRGKGELAAALENARQAVAGLDKNSPQHAEARRLQADILRALLQPAAQETLTGLPTPTGDVDATLAAAIAGWDWESALRLARQRIDDIAAGPAAYYTLAQILVQRAEAQRLCDDLDVTAHAPGAAALGETARRAGEHALQSAEAQLHRHFPSGSLPAETQVALKLCQARLDAAFRPRAQAVEALDKALAAVPAGQRSPQDFAAHRAAARRTGQRLARATDPLQITGFPLVQVQIALELAASQPAEAFPWAQAALESANLLAAEGGFSIPPAMLNFLLARLGLAVGQFPVAQRAITAALQAWPDEPRWHALAAEVAAANQNPGQVFAHLEEALRLAPNDPALLLARGQAALQAGDRDPFELEQALQLGERLTRLAPENAATWLLLAQAHRRLGHPTNAADCAERAARLAPQHIEAHLLLAEIALQTGEAARSHQYAQAALTLRPNDPRAFGCLRDALQALQAPGEALRLLEKSLSQTPPNFRLALEIERLHLLHQANGAAALESATHLAKAHPNEPAVLTALAHIQAECEQTEAAIATAQRALQCHTRREAARQPGENGGPLPAVSPASLHTLLGGLLRRAGQLDQAVYHLSQAVQWEPAHLEAHLQLGRAQQERRQHRLALQSYRQAMSLAPQDTRPYLYAGLACKEAKDYAEAENMLRRAADLSPNDVTIRRQLAAVVALNLVNGQRRPRASWPVLRLSEDPQPQQSPTSD